MQILQISVHENIKRKVFLHIVLELKKKESIGFIVSQLLILKSLIK